VIADPGELARIGSLDVDGSGFPRLAEDDPVVAELIAAYPGLRPVCFYSPYEAAAWAIIGHRIRMVQAAAIKARIAEHHGQCVTVAGESLYAFPTPLVLRGLSRVPGLPQTKVERLRVLADATLAGDLDAAHLRAMPVADALAHLRTLPGIGPFSAELILFRGSAHPDVFPRHERRLHASMAEAYGLGDPNAGQLRPHRARTIRFRRCRAHPVLVRIPGVYGDIRLYGALRALRLPYLRAHQVEWPSSAGKARRSTLPSEAPRYAAGVKPSRNRMLAASENGPRGVMTMAVIVSLRAW
jgi:3-methyladenine DNA glycosylase/8-oxoguanine DNA glycosylase